MKRRRWPALILMVYFIIMLFIRLQPMAYLPPVFRAIGVQHNSSGFTIYPGMEQPPGVSPEGIEIFYYRDVASGFVIDNRYWSIVDGDGSVITLDQLPIFYESNGNISNGYLGYGPDGVWVSRSDDDLIRLRYTWLSPGQPGFKNKPVP